MCIRDRDTTTKAALSVLRFSRFLADRRLSFQNSFLVSTQKPRGIYVPNIELKINPQPSIDVYKRQVLFTVTFAYFFSLLNVHITVLFSVL